MYVECTAHASRMPSSTDQYLAPVHHCHGDRDESVSYLSKVASPCSPHLVATESTSMDVLSNLPGATA